MPAHRELYPGAEQEEVDFIRDLEDPAKLQGFLFCKLIQGCDD